MGCRCFEALSDGQPGGGGGAPVVLPSYLLWGRSETLDVVGLTPLDAFDYVLPANRIANDGDGIHAVVYGDWIYPAGAATYRVQITWSLGGVILWQGNTVLVPASASRYAYSLEVYIARKSATTCALGGVQHQQRSAIVPSSFGVGALTAPGTSLDGGPASSGPVDPIVDWTADQAVSCVIAPFVDGGTWSVRAAEISTFAS